MTLLRRLFLASISLLLGSISAQAQVPLASSTYTQDFNTIGGGLPTGWVVTSTATATSLGTAATFNTAAVAWNVTSGQWYNGASATGMTGAEVAATQSASTNRALAVRQTGSFGDNSPAGNFAAASFYFSTVGRQVTSISFLAQMLSVQPRSTTWALQYGIGASPSSWVTVATFPDPASFGSTLVTASGFGSALNNQANAWLRVIATAASSGSGSRDSFGIDDFTILTSATSSDTPPSITTPPAGQTVTEGAIVQFTVAASGTAPLSFQWRKGGDPLSDSISVSGALTDTLTLTGVAVGDAGSYDVVVTNSAGNAISPAALLAVNPLLLPPAITTHPTSVVVAPGGTANFTVAATGSAPLSYQWRKDGVALINGPTVAGAHSASLSLSAVTADAAGAYDVVVSGTGPNATSNLAILAVPAIITPTSQIAYTGGTYATSFDTLPATGTVTLASEGPLGLDAAPISASGLGGWSLAKYAGSGSVALFRIESGTGTSGSVYSFGSTAATERALGSLSSGSTVSRFGATVVNSTGRTITEFTLAYTGEQWRRGTGSANVLTFAYALDPANLNTGDFTTVPALNFTAPVTAGSGLALDGNAPANRARISATVTGLNWAPGQVLVLRWTDVDDSGGDDGLAIDNLAFSTPVSTGATLPAVISITPADGTVNIATNTAFSVMFNQPVNFSSAAVSLVGTTSGSHPVTVSGGSQTFTLTPDTPFAEGEDVLLTLLAAQVTDAATGTQNLYADYVADYITFSSSPLAIHKVQGSGLASAYAGYPVTVQGVVVARFQGAGEIGGFYLEAPDAQHDANPATSEGILVFDNANPVTVGDFVTVTGTVTEYGTAPATGTEIASVTSFVNAGPVEPMPTAVPVTLPFASASFAERYEGMLVTLPQSLTVTNNYDIGIFGEIVVSNGRLNTPTNVVAPGAAAQALDAANKLNQIAVDDGRSGNYPDPTPYLSDSGGKGLTRRTGSLVSGLTGILDQKFGGYLVEVTAPPTFTDTEPRGNAPAVAGTLRVAIGNVLNYFNGDGAGGGFPTSRGATNYAEYLRQREKIIAGILALAPDIMGLTEVENDKVTNGLTDSYGPTSAIADLVNGLNAAAPSGTTYAYVNAAAVDIVTDVIHCAFIYRVETVATVGLPAMLNHPAFNNVARNPLAQTFRQISNGEKLTVSINHFRAKGSVAAGAGNTDSGDGQGNNNGLRLLEANALTAWLATDPTGSGDPDFLIIGDLNAYAKEDPITAIESAGYINLTEIAEGVGGWSYQFGGAFGHLDHALANSHLAAQVVDADTWHVNADEPEYYDYNTENKSAAQQAINVGGPHRYSDHDPVVIGLNLQPPAAPDVTGQLTFTKSGLRLNASTQRYTQSVTIKNTGPALAAPVTLILTQLPAGVSLYNPVGFTQVVTPLNSPYRTVGVGADNILSTGEAVSIILEFTSPSSAAITYTLKAVAGPGGR